METYYRGLSGSVLEDVSSKVASSVMSVGGSHRQGNRRDGLPVDEFLGKMGESNECYANS